MKQNNVSQLDLVERMCKVRRSWKDELKYSVAYKKEFGEIKDNTLFNVWHLKSLSKHIDVIENFEKLVKKYSF